jgi:hypothetical protein
MPILKNGRIVQGSRRSSLYNTISLNSSYMLSLLKTPGLIEDRDKLLAFGDRHPRLGLHAQDERLANEAQLAYALQTDLRVSGEVEQPGVLFEE